MAINPVRFEMQKRMRLNHLTTLRRIGVSGSGSGSECSVSGAGIRSRPHRLAILQMRPSPASRSPSFSSRLADNFSLSLRFSQISNIFLTP